jgi:hypothetical protein
MNKKGVSVLGVILLLLLIAGGAYAYLTYKDFDFSFGKNKTNQTITLNETNETKVVCLQNDFPDIDKVAYYFDNTTYQGLNVFMDNSKTYLHCAFTSLESQNYASQFVALKNAGIDVKIQFGIEDTMKDCEITCVPKLESQYNYLLGEGVPVSYSRINFNFCVNEKAIYVFSLIPGDIPSQDYGLIVFNSQLRDKYESYFQTIFDY